MGVSSGMPVRMALRLCPEAVLVRGHSEQYGEYSRMVTALMQETLPVVEKALVHEFYADLSGMDKYLGCLRLASELRSRITRETGLPSSLGLSVNKTVSKVATGQAKPDNQYCVRNGDEARFLAPLPVRKIPMVGLFGPLSWKSWVWAGFINCKKFPASTWFGFLERTV